MLRIFFRILCITVTECIRPLGGRKELKRTIRSMARILSQSILQAANLFVISSVVSASLSSSPQSWAISSSSSEKYWSVNFSFVKVLPSIRHLPYHPHWSFLLPMMNFPSIRHLLLWHNLQLSPAIFA